MAQQKAENCIRTLFDDVWNCKQTHLVDELCSDDFAFHFEMEASDDREGGIAQANALN